MHSVSVHLVDVTHLEVSDYLDSCSVKGLREHWYFPNRTVPVFTVHFPHADSLYKSDGERAAVTAVMGRESALTLVFDVGAKQPGHRELREFLCKFLTEYSGVALDHLSTHVWTVEDLRADRHVGGYAFADHEAVRKAHVSSHGRVPTPHPTNEH